MKKTKKQKEETAVIEVPKGISSGWYYIIRYIAIISMLADHLGKVLYSTGHLSYDHLIFCNMFGRMAFPLFAFELVECYFHTKDWKNHLGKLGLLAFISEIPFDMAMVHETPFKFSLSAFDCQNTCLTLFFGFLYMKITDINWNNVLEKLYKSKALKKFGTFAIKLLIFALFVVLTAEVGCDYTWRGMTLIALFHFARKRKFTKIFQLMAVTTFVILMGTSVMIYMTVFFTLIPIYLAECKKKMVHNEKLEKILTSKVSTKISTFFYPAHLVILTIIKAILMA